MLAQQLRGAGPSHLYQAVGTIPATGTAKGPAVRQEHSWLCATTSLVRAWKDVLGRQTGAKLLGHWESGPWRKSDQHPCAFGVLWEQSRL